MSLTNQADLFSESIGLDWLPDETVHSWASRYHRISGNARSQTTAVRLFGGRFCGFLHDAPAGIAHFARVNRGSLGSAHTILLSHTVLPFHLLFRPARLAPRAMVALSSTRIGLVRTWFQLTASRIGPTRHLKACRSCLETDQRDFGVAYWHLTHQLPGVCVCPMHGDELKIAPPRTGTERYQWYLPTLEPERSTGTTSSKGTLDAPNRLARLVTSAVHESAQFEFDSAALLATYQTALVARDLSPAAEIPQIRSTARAFHQAMQPLAEFGEFSSILHDVKSAQRILSAVLRAQPNGGNSLGHLMVIAWLFGNWGKFCRQYARVRHEIPATKVIRCARYARVAWIPPRRRLYRDRRSWGYAE